MTPPLLLSKWGFLPAPNTQDGDVMHATVPAEWTETNQWVASQKVAACSVQRSDGDQQCKCKGTWMVFGTQTYRGHELLITPQAGT